MEAAGFEWLNEIGDVAAHEEKAGRVGVCLHRAAQGLLANDWQGVGVVHHNPAIHTRAGIGMTDELGDGLAHAVYAAVLFGREPECPFWVVYGDPVRFVVRAEKLLHQCRLAAAVASREKDMGWIW